MKNNAISDELMAKISGGELDKRTKQEIRDAVDYFKDAGLELDYFIAQIIDQFKTQDQKEVEEYIRHYWETGIK